jgi:hypothetical protein
VTHDRIGNLVTELFADEQTIFCMEEHPERIGGAEEPVGKRLKQPQSQERKERQLLG